MAPLFCLRAYGTTLLLANATFPENHALSQLTVRMPSSPLQAVWMDDSLIWCAQYLCQGFCNT
jgi:hypothetical protein